MHAISSKDAATLNVYLRISAGLKCRSRHCVTVTTYFVDVEQAFDSMYPFAWSFLDVAQAFDSVHPFTQLFVDVEQAFDSVPLCVEQLF